MKKNKLVIAMVLAMGISATAHVSTGEAKQQVQENKSVTEVFIIESLEDGYVNAMPISKSKLKNGYILDQKRYRVGDIVEVTYWHDDVFNERVIKGKELKLVKRSYRTEIKKIMN